MNCADIAKHKCEKHTKEFLWKNIPSLSLMMISALGRDTVTPPADVVIEAVKNSVISDKSSLTIVKVGLANVVTALSVKFCLVPEKSVISVDKSSISDTRMVEVYICTTCGSSGGKVKIDFNVSLQATTQESKLDYCSTVTFIHCVSRLQKPNVDR